LETTISATVQQISGETGSDVFSSTSQETVPEGETSQEWDATPVVQFKLHSLNSFLRQSSSGRLSPIRSQLRSDIADISSTTNRYYRRKAVQAVESVLDAIAPGNSTWLFNQVSQTFSQTDVDTSDNTLLSKLVKLYYDASSWYTRQQILSIFAKDYAKSELLRFIPGLTKWRIDEARSYAVLAGPGRAIDPPVIHRSRLDPTKVDNFLDFLSSPSFLQDVAYGTKTLKLSDGEKIEIPSVVRTIIASRLVQLYQSYCNELGFTPLGRSTLFSILKVRVCT